MTKDTDEQPDEEKHRTRSRRVMSAGASVLMELGCTTLLVRECVHQRRSSLNPIVQRFLWRLHHIVMINY